MRTQDVEIQTEANPIPPEAAPPRFLSRSEVARRYGVSLSTVTRWARTGIIRAVRTPGGHYRYPAGELPANAPDPMNLEQGGPQ